MTLVIESWNGKYMYGNYDGGTGRSVNQTWNCESISSYPFGSCFPSSSYGHLVYITQALWNSLNTRDQETAKARSQGMVGTGYFEIKPWLGSDGKYWDRKYFVPAAILQCWKQSCFDLRPDLVCKDVVCDDICINADKYSQACVTEGEDAGECAIDQLLEANSPDCPGYDPCKDVVCDPKCYEYDLHGQVCENGICIKGVLIEADNREICGYDPCKDVVCEDKCYGVDKYSNVCEEGVCVVGQLVEPNSTDCGYVPHVCNEGELRGATVCEDGSTIYAEVCQNNKWVLTGDKCPDDPIPPVPDPDETDWTTYALIGVALVLFYLLATRG